MQIAFVGLFLFSCGYTDVEPPMTPPMCCALLFHMYTGTTWDVKSILLYEASFQKITNPLRASKGQLQIEKQL